MAARLTARLPASVHSWTLLREGAREPSRTPPRRGVIDRVRRIKSEPLTLHVAPARCSVARAARLRRGSVPPRPRQRARLPRLEAPSIDRCLRSRALARHRTPASESRLCRRRFAFRRLFATPSSRASWLDLPRFPRALHPWSRGAERRLSTSAIEHDPRARWLERPNPANHTGGRPPAQLLIAGG